MVTAVIQLKEIMKGLDENKLKQFLSTFKCSRNKDSEHFLKKIAMKHEIKSISRTYLVIKDGRIEGYFTLAIKCVNVDGYNPLPVTAELMNLNKGIAQAYLIGQLARSDDATPGTGSSMIIQALKKFSIGKHMFGCPVIRLDCKDELIEYYSAQGFQWIGKDMEIELNQMIMIM